ncbi:glycosyltransferase [Archangium gephyra]|uniref:glycosyltransferase n=1 Tax=Archangium gephyra TaxID=48 RepID=UPI003B7D1CF0
MASVGSVILTVLAGGVATLAVVLVSLTAFLYLLYRDDLRSRRSASGPWAEQEVVRPPSGKLRFALFYWGSRGDFQPLAVLAQQLKREGHSVLINVRERYREAGLSLGLEESELFAQEEDHTEDVVTVQLQGKSGPRGIYYLFRHVAEHTPAYLRQFDEMVTRAKADVLIVNEFALNVGILAADKHRLPLFVLRYTPLFTATTERLCPMVGTGDKGGFLNWLSYTLPSFMRIFLEGPVLRRLRRVHGLSARPALSYFFGRGFWQYPAIQAYSSTLMPVPHKDLPPWYFNPGPLLPPSQEETEAVPEALSDFLRRSGEQPIIYIGFGSFSLLQFLPLAQARQAAHAMLGAVQELGIRAILLEHTFDFMLEDPILQNPQWYMGKRFPHSWLFPRVSVIVHQGGAGHCAASARSGRPTIAIPIFEEQEVNAQALVSAGVAVRLRIQELTRESFKRAFQEVLRLEGQARGVGARLDEQVRHSGETAVKELLGWLGSSRAEPQRGGVGARGSG